MIPRIELMTNKSFIGIRRIMSLKENETHLLWKTFMPLRKEIKNVLDSNLYSIQIYGSQYFQHFNPNNQFEKWAAVEVSDLNSIPTSLESLTIPGGMYAVFYYKGLSTDTAIFEYIFNTWLPNSEYGLDDRPYFEILGERYKNNAPDSEEEIWIPIKNK